MGIDLKDRIARMNYGTKKRQRNDQIHPQILRANAYPLKQSTRLRLLPWTDSRHASRQPGVPYSVPAHQIRVRTVHTGGD